MFLLYTSKRVLCVLLLYAYFPLMMLLFSFSSRERERDTELNMRLTGGKQKLDYLLASIADYSAPLVFFITLFYCTNLLSFERGIRIFFLNLSALALSGRAI